MADFFDRGLKIGSAYQEGQDAATKRGIDQRAADDVSAGRQALTKAQGLANTKNEYEQGRQRDYDTEANKIWTAPPTGSAGGPPATTPTLDDYGKPLEGAAPQAAAPGAPATGPDARGLQLQQKAQRSRAQAVLEGRFGNFDKANKADAEADSADMTAVFEKGATRPTEGPEWDATAAKLTQSSKLVQIGKDKKGRDMLSVQDPSGKTEYKTLTEADKKNLNGALAMFNAGYVTAALGIMNKIDANLATAAHLENEQRMKISSQNNTTQHQESQDDAAMITANAHATSAKAAADRVNMEKTKQAFGQPVNYIDDQGNAQVMQPVLVNGKMSMEKVDLPAGAKFPKQAPDQKFVKTGPNGGIFQDSLTGEALGKVDEEGNLVPMGKDPFAGKEGEKKLADWQDKGVIRRLGKDAKNRWHWGYTADPENPDAKPWSTPEEAFKNKPAGAAPKPLPAEAPRGMQMQVANPFKGLYAETPAGDPAAAEQAVRDKETKARQPQGLLGL